MADHVETGLRKILEIPAVYTFYQQLLYPKSSHFRYIKDFVRPFPGAKIMDIGCGPGTVLDYLLPIVSDLNYNGYDFNPMYIKKANEKYTSIVNKSNDKNLTSGNNAENATIQFFCERVSKVDSKESDKYDIVMANAILHHLNDEEAAHLYDTAYHVLKPGGHLVTFDGVFIPNQNPFAKWLIKKDRGQNVRTEEEQLSIAEKYFQKNQMIIDHDFFRIPYTIIIGRHIK